MRFPSDAPRNSAREKTSRLGQSGQPATYLTLQVFVFPLKTLLGNDPRTDTLMVRHLQPRHFLRQPRRTCLQILNVVLFPLPGSSSGLPVSLRTAGIIRNAERTATGAKHNGSDHPRYGVDGERHKKNVSSLCVTPVPEQYTRRLVPGLSLFHKPSPQKQKRQTYRSARLSSWSGDPLPESSAGDSALPTTPNRKLAVDEVLPLKPPPGTEAPAKPPTMSPDGELPEAPPRRTLTMAFVAPARGDTTAPPPPPPMPPLLPPPPPALPPPALLNGAPAGRTPPDEEPGKEPCGPPAPRAPYLGGEYTPRPGTGGSTAGEETKKGEERMGGSGPPPPPLAAASGYRSGGSEDG